MWVYGIVTTDELHVLLRITYIEGVVEAVAMEYDKKYVKRFVTRVIAWRSGQVGENLPFILRLYGVGVLAYHVHQRQEKEAGASEEKGGRCCRVGAEV
jgi:hypothetical protein